VSVRPYFPTGPIAVSTVSPSVSLAVAAACRGQLAPLPSVALTACLVGIVRMLSGAIAIIAWTHVLA
jgi:hypothetical protein